MANRSSPRSAVVLVCDRLNPAFLGPYGNTWIETAATNQLASESMLVEQCLTTSLGLQANYDVYWSGLSSVSQSKTFVTDDAVLMSHPRAEDFDTHVQLPSSDDKVIAADSIEETSWATLMLAALQQREEMAGGEKGTLLWVHGQGCEGDWNAPFALRESFAGEDDPPPPDFVARPSRCMDVDADPDELLGLQQAYAAEIAAFDHCLMPLVESLANMSNTLFVLTSPRGFPLGEHSVVGDARPVLQFESLHVPLIIRFPDGRYQAERIHSLWQPSDVSQILQQWLSGDEIVIEELGAERVAAQAPDAWSLRTPAWFASGSTGANLPDAETRLYVKPDDRFEVNDVAGICNDVAADMRVEFERLVEASASGTTEQLPPLSDELRVPQD